MKKLVKKFYCSQRFCGLKILKIQIIVQTAQFLLTFVIGSVRKKLKLPPLKYETMIFRVFGQNDNKVKEIDIVQIKIKGNNGLNQKYNFAKNDYDHLRNIKLLKHSEGD